MTRLINDLPLSKFFIAETESAGCANSVKPAASAAGKGIRVYCVRQAWEKARLTYRVSMGRHQAITSLRNWRGALSPQLASQVWARPFFGS